MKQHFINIFWFIAITGNLSLIIFFTLWILLDYPKMTIGLGG